MKTMTRYRLRRAVGPVVALAPFLAWLTYALPLPGPLLQRVAIVLGLTAAFVAVMYPICWVIVWSVWAEKPSDTEK